MVVMDDESFEQYEIPEEDVLDEPRRKLLEDGITLEINFLEGEPLSVMLPKEMVATVGKEDTGSGVGDATKVDSEGQRVVAWKCGRTRGLLPTVGRCVVRCGMVRWCVVCGGLECDFPMQFLGFLSLWCTSTSVHLLSLQVVRLKNGLPLKVPGFVAQGDEIVINTNDMEYVRRA